MNHPQVITSMSGSVTIEPFIVSDFSSFSLYIIKDLIHEIAILLLLPFAQQTNWAGKHKSIFKGTTNSDFAQKEQQPLLGGGGRVFFRLLVMHGLLEDPI